MPMTSLDLTTAITQPAWGTQVSGASIVASGTTVYHEFIMPLPLLTSGTGYRFEIDATLNGGGLYINAYSQQAATVASYDLSMWHQLSGPNTVAGTSTRVMEMGPGVQQWNAALAETPPETYILWAFKGNAADFAVTAMRYEEVTVTPPPPPPADTTFRPLTGAHYGHGGWKYRVSNVDSFTATNTLYAAKNYDDSSWDSVQAPVATSQYTYAGVAGGTTTNITDRTWANTDTGPASLHGGPGTVVPSHVFWVRKHFTRAEMEQSYSPGNAAGVIHVALYGSFRAWWNGAIATSAGFPFQGAFDASMPGLAIQDDNVLAIHVGRFASTAYPLPVGDRAFGMYIDAYPLRQILPVTLGAADRSRRRFT